MIRKSHRYFLSVSVSLNPPGGSAYPRIIPFPPFIGKWIRKGDMKLVQLYLSFFSINKIILIIAKKVDKTTLRSMTDFEERA